ncbi:MAG: sodium/proton-translocating pyrophosphatase [Phycisphaeraceae bacterium]
MIDLAVHQPAPAGFTLAQSGAAFAGADLPGVYWLAPLAAVAALVTASLFYRQIMRRSEGGEAMVRVATAVRAGAYAYLRRQYLIVAIAFALLVVVLLIVGLGLRAQSALSAVGVPVAGLFPGRGGDGPVRDGFRVVGHQPLAVRTHAGV